MPPKADAKKEPTPPPKPQAKPGGAQPVENPEYEQKDGPTGLPKTFQVFTCLPSKKELFRILADPDDESKKGEKELWFYNDTTEKKFTVKVKLSKGSVVVPGENAKCVGHDDKDKKEEEREPEASCSILPGKTEKICAGKIKGFSISIASSAVNAPAAAEPLEDPKYERDGPKNIGKENQQVYAVLPSKKELFRIVTDAETPLDPAPEGDAANSVQKALYFYNDTTDKKFTIKAKFSEGSIIKEGPNATLDKIAPAKEGGAEIYETTVVLKPNETELCGHGVVRGFSVQIAQAPWTEESAEGGSEKKADAAPAAAEGEEATAKKEGGEPAASSSTGGGAAAVVAPSPPGKDGSQNPRAAAVAKKRDPPKYENDGPKGVEGDLAEDCDIVGCFEGGKLFRIINNKTKNWWFYNDTNDMDMSVKITFGKGAEITVKGTAKIDAEAKPEEEGAVVVDDVIKPLQTNHFIEGKYTSFKCQFSGEESADKVVCGASDEILKAEREACEQLALELKYGKDAAKDKKAEDETEWDILALLDACVERKMMFVDLSFPPEKKSLFREGKDDEIQELPWQRPRHYLSEEQGKKIGLVLSKVEPNDIDQGALGDCWFLCAIASLAEFPEKVLDLFTHPKGKEAMDEENFTCGAHRVYILHNGWFEMIVVDSYLPTIGRAPAFAKNREEPAELWVSMLEKAFAKLNGSYSNIVGGDPLHALEDLTGYPTARLDTKWQACLEDKDKRAEMFSELVRRDEAGYLISVGTPSAPEDEEEAKAFEEKYKAAGLTLDHAYSVTVVKEFPDKDIRLMKIRNPWGSDKEWTGKWNDHDELWKTHEDVAKACEFDGPSADGTFWMAFEDALEYFESAGVCFMSTNWHDCRIRNNWHSAVPDVALQVTCKKETKVFITLSQAVNAGYGEAPKTEGEVPVSKYAGSMVTIFKKATEKKETDEADGVYYDVIANSNAEWDKPAPEFTFLVGRTIGMLYTFEPSDEPYYVLPRAYHADTTKAFNLGLISKEAFGGSTIDVEFKKVSGDLELFKNYAHFKMADSDVVAVDDVEFQINPEAGAPYTAKGGKVEEK